ncbi:MAG TPA: hypothetical protein VFB45_13980 [Pseudolabrys sp.]|nr:hypothetical protein [Pseudolabrys sp.]
MCDYSLEHVISRAAQVADKLVSTSFSNSITRGFAAADDINTAVCLLPGTEIAFDRDVSFEHPVTYAPQTLPHKVARFRQVDLDREHAHHDALEFPDGQVVLLTKLLPGQHATVLQLPAEAKAGEHREDTPAPIAEPLAHV